MKVKFTVFILLGLLTLRKNARSQWLQVVDPGGSYGGSYVSCLTSFEGKLFAGTVQVFQGTEGGVFFSTNDGLNWIAVNNGLTNPHITVFATEGKNIFAGTTVDSTRDGTLFLSTNSGANWSDISKNFPDTSDVYSLAISEGNLFAGVASAFLAGEIDNPILLTTDNGTSWSNASGEYTSSGSPGFIAASDDRLFWGIPEAGVNISTDNGLSWIPSSNGLPLNANVACFGLSGSSIFAGLDSIGLPSSTGNGVYRSTDSGATWTAVNNGMINEVVRNLIVFNGNLFAATANGVFLSTNNGASWKSLMDESTPSLNVHSLTISDGYLFAAVFYSQLWRFPLSDLHLSSVQPQPQPATAGGLRVFPNPAAGTLQILGGPSGTARLYDALGRERLRARDNGSGATLDVSRLPVGTYFLRIGGESAKVLIAH